MNPGYIEHWAAKNMSKWDSSVERRAGGLDHSMTMEAQEFAMTNLSSLYALIASVARDFYHGKLSSETSETSETSTAKSLIQAAKSLRVLLFLNSSAGDIEMLNSAENMEQQERKKHSELDNIAAIQEWMHSMRSVCSALDPTKALDVYKFACTRRPLGDPLARTMMHSLASLEPCSMTPEEDRPT